MTSVADLAAAIGSGTIRVVDLTNPLSSSTPTLRLPEPFANLIDFSLEQVSAYDEPGPFWKHHNIHTGEHIGTHLDAPIHWVTGRDGRRRLADPAARLVGPAVVHGLHRARRPPTPTSCSRSHHVQAWEAEHGALPDGALGAVPHRVGPVRRTTRSGSSTSTRPAPTRPGVTAEPAPSGWRGARRSPGSAWRRSASTPATPARWSRRSRAPLTCWAPTSTASPRCRTSRSCPPTGARDRGGARCRSSAARAARPACWRWSDGR